VAKGRLRGGVPKAVILQSSLERKKCMNAIGNGMVLPMKEIALRLDEPELRESLCASSVWLRNSSL